MLLKPLPIPYCSWAQFTQDAEQLATGARQLCNTLWSMRVFTQLASNIKGFADKCAHASCVNGPLYWPRFQLSLKTEQTPREFSFWKYVDVHGS